MGETDRDIDKENEIVGDLSCMGGNYGGKCILTILRNIYNHQ